MKEWTCEQCVKKDTDACYYRNVIDGYKYCKDVLVDTDVAYKQGIEDGIDSAISNALWYLWASHTEIDQKGLEKYVKKMCAEELKEQI